MASSPVELAHKQTRGCGSLREFLPHLRGKAVRLFTDNTTVAVYVNKQVGGARSIPLSVRLEEILLWCQSSDILLSARHIPGKLNIVADALSRSHMVLQTEWTLCREVLTPIWQAWHRSMVNLFSTRFNHRLEMYVSPVPDPGTLAVDKYLSFRCAFSGSRAKSDRTAEFDFDHVMKIAIETIKGQKTIYDRKYYFPCRKMASLAFYYF